MHQTSRGQPALFWQDPRTHPRGPDALAPRRPRDYAESCVPVGVDPWQPSRVELEGRDRLEIPDHLGGFLRAVQLTPADQEADDDWMLSGDPLPDGEDEAAAARRRRLREAAFRWGVRR